MNDNLFKYLVLTKIHTSCSLVWILNSFEHCHPVAQCVAYYMPKFY
ncbi:hypothetical protein EJK55_0579 [Moraxella catarrhalis]|uniref:Uncharacterized protein n=1 Tax=Moraxella catarrhalis TaxID=480 RepID=A0ABY0BKR3_MORCA|nr:hypothetical protein MCR_1448 [Moraxella catarrhalis BBH18]AZQ86798.1 hypothetical protein EJK52_1918 [Moraxella catarrhalis]ADG62120.1 hypothetical protein MCR_1864 [Moraxella catarrhalis BBH18]AZQ88251.1 hypothetical protein EJK52_1518 [Moraxella catarrhalis]AZQ89512.1 hypothetical protein EJK50_1584 [Moraxella catarrhalis]